MIFMPGPAGMAQEATGLGLFSTFSANIQLVTTRECIEGIYNPVKDIPAARYVQGPSDGKH